MPSVSAAAITVVAAYAIGTFPSAQVVGRRAGRDVTHEGSGNPGASNVYRLAGRRAGAEVFAADVVKGAVATLLGLLLAGSSGALLGGAAAVVGHCFPITRWRHGGKGVATAAGFLLVLEPLLVLPGLLVWLAVARLTRKASVASLLLALGFPLAVLGMRGLGQEAAAVAGVAALVVARHGGNLRRLRRGEERSIS